MSPNRLHPIAPIAWLAAGLVLGFIAAPAKSYATTDHSNDATVTASAPLATGAARLAKVKQLQLRMALADGYAELREHRARALAARRHGRRPAAHPDRGERQRPVLLPELGGGRPPAMPAADRAQPLSTNASDLGPNVLVSDTTGDRADGAGQSEPGIAAWNQFVLIGWNEGAGYRDDSDLMGYGYSIDGGLSFTHAGPVPHAATIRWTSDPVFTVNEKTGEFYFVGLIENSAHTTNGLAIARAHFNGTTIQWDQAQVISSVSNTSFIDKPWAAVDSSTGKVYVSYTVFTASSDNIAFQHSTTDWHTYAAPVVMNDGSGAGRVQGSRPITGPGGEVYVVWKEIGPSSGDGSDYFMIRKSVNFGGTFTAPRIAASIFDNFGTGAPGFNRERGITFPSIAVDRSFGPHRGRVYIAWNDCLDWYRDLDAAGALGTVNESEPNNSPLNATPFTPGQTLVGQLTWTPTPSPGHGELDYWKFPATQGTTYTFWCDSIPASLYTMRVICSDDTTRLNLTGAIDLPIQGTNGFLTWTCPVSGTYFIRMFSDIPGNSTSSYYSILTGVNTHLTEPGRDQRDVVVVASDDGLTWPAAHGGVRTNSDAPWFDNWLPEVAVSGNGTVYTFFYGFQDAFPPTCGGESHNYLDRSDDGGLTWHDVGRVTDTITSWSRTFTNIQPNQGDYLGLFANDLTLFNAWSDGRNGNADIFALAVPLTSTPTLVSLANADADAKQVRVTWYAASDQITEAYVYRLDGADWVLKGVIDADGQHRMTYVDNDVYPGVKYSYRLGVQTGGMELYMGEVSVIVPSIDKVRIESVRPNPTTREVWVSFTLPRATPATLSLVDITGRRIRVREVGSLGTGKHLLELASGLTLPAGMYVVRLDQGGVVQTTRVSVVR